MKNNALRLFVSLFSVSVFSSANAGLIPPPGHGAQVNDGATLELGVVHSLSAESRYNMDVASYGTDDLNIKRKTTSAYAGYGDFFLAAGMIHRTEVETTLSRHDYPMPLMAEAGFTYLPEQEESIDGDGFMVALGVRSTLWKKDCLSLAAYGQLTYRRESCSSTSDYVSYDTPVYEVRPEIYPPVYPSPDPISGTVENDIDLDSTELLVGFVGRFNGQRYSFYAGIEITPYSDMSAEITVVTSGGTMLEEEYDIEPSEPVTFLLGWQASFKHGFMMLESRALGEKSLRVGAGVNF